MQPWQQRERTWVEEAGQWNPGVRAARGARWRSDVEACLTIEAEGQTAKGKMQGESSASGAVERPLDSYRSHQSFVGSTLNATAAAVAGNVDAAAGYASKLLAGVARIIDIVSHFGMSIGR